MLGGTDRIGVIRIEDTLKINQMVMTPTCAAVTRD